MSEAALQTLLRENARRYCAGTGCKRDGPPEVL
jgi:hypothetical protein